MSSILLFLIFIPLAPLIWVVATSSVWTNWSLLEKKLEAIERGSRIARLEFEGKLSSREAHDACCQAVQKFDRDPIMAQELWETYEVLQDIYRQRKALESRPTPRPIKE